MTSTNVIRRRQRIKLYHQQNGICWYCPAKMLLEGHKKHPQLCTADHRIPVSRGGKQAMTNRVACCFQCNVWKGSLTEMEFRALGPERSRQLNEAASHFGSIHGSRAFVAAIERLAAEALQSLQVAA